MKPKTKVLFGLVVVAAACGAGLLLRKSRPWWTGTVVDGEGRPIAGALVTMNVPESAGEATGPSTTTDADGRFRFDVEVPNLDEFLVEHPGFVPQSIDGHSKRPFALTLTSAASMSGRVLSSADRSPIAGAVVAAIAYRVPMWRYERTTDAAGIFRLEGLETGHSTEFLVQVPGAVPFIEAIDVPQPHAIEHDFVVAMQPIVKGRVIDLESHAPISDAEIVPIGFGKDLSCRAITRSGANGMFEIAGPFDARPLMKAPQSTPD